VAFPSAALGVLALWLALVGALLLAGLRRAQQEASA
jgi:hypothetical protein